MEIMVSGITFDAGGTLLHPYPSVGQIYSEVMQWHGLEIRAEALEQSFRKAWKMAHQTPRVGVTEESEKEWWRKMVSETLKGLGEAKDFNLLFEDLWVAFAEPGRWRLYDGVREVLEELRGRGYRLAILSNWDRRLRGLLDQMELSPLFEHLIISSEVGEEKPSSRIFQAAVERMKLSPSEMLHVGDSVYHDLNGARNAGWQGLLIHHSSGASFETEGLSRMSELLYLLPDRGCVH